MNGPPNYGSGGPNYGGPNQGGFRGLPTPGGIPQAPPIPGPAGSGPRPTPMGAGPYAQGPGAGPTSQPGYGQPGLPSFVGTGSYPGAGSWSGDMAPQSGFAVQAVGRYELLMELASGGMGAVYVGRQRGAAGFERVVAIKRMHPHLTQNQPLVLAFHEEARIASMIHHPNVVNVVDVYEEAGEHLLVMEYIDGVALATLVGEARKRGMVIPRGVAMRIAIDTLAGLHAAHELCGIDGQPLLVVHRDVSPQNILVAGDGTVRITDFGIARALERAVHTATGELKGKLRYMAPEQALGQPVDRRSDVFALGIVLWEMLTGQKLHKGESELEVLRAVASEPIPSPRQFDPSIPVGIERTVMAALSHAPEHRYPTARAFAEALQGWAWESRELAEAAQVAEVVSALVGDRITQRRQYLADVLTGRKAISPKLTGTHPVAAAPLYATPTGHPFVSPPSVATVNTKKSRSLFVVLGAASLSAAIGVGAVLAYTRAPKPPAGASDASAPATGASTATPGDPSTATPAGGTVKVTLRADEPITAVRGPGVADVAFDASGASLTLPKGDAKIELSIDLKSGATLSESVTPSVDLALHVVAPAGSAAASASAAPSEIASAGPAPKGAPKGPRPTAGRPTVEPPPGLRKSPYGN